MQKNSYLNGIKIGKATKASINFFLRKRNLMLAKSGDSKCKKVTVNLSFLFIIILMVAIITYAVYFVLGILGTIIFLIFVLFLPRKYASIKENDEVYNFNDGYRDGPEGSGYYSGGYKVDE